EVNTNIGKVGNILNNLKNIELLSRIKDIFSPVLKKTEVNTNIGKVENILNNLKNIELLSRIKDIFSPVLKKTEVNTNIGKVENILNNLKNIELLSIKNISESTKAFTIFAKIGDKISPYFKTLYSKLGPLGVITTLLTGIYIATSSTNDGTRGPGQPQKKSPLETALDVTFFGLFIKDLWTIT